MCEKIVSKICEGCGEDTWVWEVKTDDGVEYYCNECLANILTEDPTTLYSMKRVEDTF